MKTIIQIYRELRQRLPEIYFRLRHSVLTFKKRFPGIAIGGRIELPNEFKFQEDASVNRGEPDCEGRYYSKINQLDWERIPLSIKRAIKNYDSVLKLYLGDGYTINEGRLWRNYPIPQQYRNSELFSQYWHYDKVVDFRNIQLFVLLGDVTVDDGPFEFVVRPDEKKIMHSVLKRNNEDLNIRGIKTKKLIGSRGDSFLFSTGSTPHRAGIPAEGHFRDIFSIAFFPSYAQVGVSSELLLREVE
ncbi:MAG: hypothetical protein ABII81_09660 [Pseudomonadota bacterium]